MLRKVIYYDRLKCGLVYHVHIQGSAQRSALRTRVGGEGDPPHGVDHSGTRSSAMLFWGMGGWESFR